MSETSNPSTAQPQPPQEFHWGISYLREDIQDLRQEFRSVHTRIDGTNQRIDEVNISLRTRIDEQSQSLHKALRSQFAWLMTTMIALAGIIVAVTKL